MDAAAAEVEGAVEVEGAEAAEEGEGSSAARGEARLCKCAAGGLAAGRLGGGVGTAALPLRFCCWGCGSCCDGSAGCDGGCCGGLIRVRARARVRVRVSWLVA